VSEYVKVRSWHILRTYTRVPEMAVTLCGRLVRATETRAELPAERSCESCLRIATRRVDA
jgi:hypothetical protein